jgi:hypothetical protein
VNREEFNIQQSQEEWIRRVGQDKIELLIRKDRDYGSAFSRRFAKHGILSAFIRMEDKWLRLENLISGHEPLVQEEKLIDTLKDLSGYIDLTIIELLKESENDQQ